MGYRHTRECELGIAYAAHIGKLGDIKYRYECGKCGAGFICKNYANAGDSCTKECPICWAVAEAKVK